MQENYFGVVDFISAGMWFFVVMVLTAITQMRNKHLSHYKYYSYNVYFKLFLGIFFGIFYVGFYPGGGDTKAYWDGAIVLNNLFYKSPYLYFDELMNSEPGYYFRFDHSTGKPPSWIYKEEASWFVSKCMSILSFITFKSYWAATIILSYIFANATWRFYEFVLKLKVHNEKILAIAILFIPSVALWCANVSKDMLVVTSILYIFVSSFRIFLKYESARIKDWLILIFMLFILWNTRLFYLLAITGPTLFVLTSLIRKKLKKNVVLVFIINYSILALALFLFIVIIVKSGAMQQYIDEAAVIQQDFLKNETYGDKRYDLGITDFSTVGVLKTFPVAVIAGIYRPFFWEALSPTLIVNGIESLVLIYFTFQFLFNKKNKGKLKSLQQNSLMMYLFYYSILMAFMAGFTGVLFGVLVRFKAAVLPFIATILTYKMGEISQEKHEDADLDENELSQT